MNATAPRIAEATSKPQLLRFEVQLLVGRAIVLAFDRNHAAQIAREAGHKVISVTLVG